MSMQGPETETPTGSDHEYEQRHSSEEMQSPTDIEEQIDVPAAAAGQSEFKRLGISKIEEMERQIQEE